MLKPSMVTLWLAALAGDARTPVKSVTGLHTRFERKKCVGSSYIAVSVGAW